MAIREIFQIDLTGGTKSQNEILHKKTRELEKADDFLIRLVNDLRDTMWAYPFCVGLSAPQIGESVAVSVLNFKKESKDDDLVIINPKVISTSGKKDKKRESCMSVWGMQGEVERRDKVEISYYDLNFNQCLKKFEGFESRAIQHEIDHLYGIVYPERIVEGKSLTHASFFDGYNIIK